MTMTEPKRRSGREFAKKYDGLARFLHVIGEHNRLKTLHLLKDGEKCVCEIIACLDMPQSLVSNHLKVLRDSGLVESRQEWKRIYYSINKKTFKKYNSLLTDFLKKYE
jgi:ArsR family transcriptional regulator